MDKELFYRSLEIDQRALDREKREAVLSFSSEEPVSRWFGSEILLHGEKNIDFRRLRSTGSVLYGHRPDEMKNIIGSLNRVWLENRRGMARMTFDQDESGDLAMGKVGSGSLKGVSFGYMIEKARQLEEREEWTDPDSNVTYRGPALVATRWVPFEISLTPIPADPTVGVGRDLTRSLAGIQLESTLQQDQRKESDMDKDQIIALIREQQAGLVSTVVEQVRGIIAEANKPRFSVSAEDFTDIMGRASVVGEKAMVEMARMLSEGKQLREMERKLLEMATTKPDASQVTPPPDVRDQASNSNRAPIYRKVSDVPDDIFMQMLTNPVTLALQ